MQAIEKQFFINAQNKHGDTALHIAYLHDFQTLSDILQREGKKLGLDITLQNKKGMTIADIDVQNQKER